MADKHIPWIREFFADQGELVLKAGTDITRHDLIDATILLTRTVTPINADLLQHTTVTYVGSVTAGYDHIDIEWLKEAGITWSYAPSANATAVAQYVLCCIAYWMIEQKLSSDSQIGVVGIGHVGSQVVRYLNQLHFTVVYNDPPRTEQEPSFISTPLSKLHDVDLLTLHTPLTTTGKYPTHHLIDAAFLARLKPGCILLNTGRGAVIDNQALLSASHVTIGLDVWEQEPNINLALLEKAMIATPHVAGYSEEAKCRATRQVYEQARQYFGWKNAVSPTTPEVFQPTALALPSQASWEEAVLHIYHPRLDTELMKKTLLKHPQTAAYHFEQLRREYPFRHEFSRYHHPALPS